MTVFVIEKKVAADVLVVVRFGSVVGRHASALDELINGAVGKAPWMHHALKSEVFPQIHLCFPTEISTVPQATEIARGFRELGDGWFGVRRMVVDAVIRELVSG